MVPQLSSTCGECNLQIKPIFTKPTHLSQFLIMKPVYLCFFLFTFSSHRLPFMFSSSRSELAYLCRQLFALRPDQLCRLTRWLGPNGLPNLVYNQKLSSRLSDSEQQTNSNCSLQEVPNEIKITTTITRGARLSLSSLLTPSSVPNNLSTSYQKSHIWKTCLPGLHRLYKSISSVADRFAREYPTELRFILQVRSYIFLKIFLWLFTRFVILKVLYCLNSVSLQL